MAITDYIPGLNKQYSAAEINAKKIALVNAFEEKASSGNRTMVIGAILLVISIICFCMGETSEESIFGYSYTTYSASYYFAWILGIPSLITILIGYNTKSKNQSKAAMFNNMDDETFVAYLKDKQNAENLANLFKGAKTVLSAIDLFSQF